MNLSLRKFLELQQSEKKAKQERKNGQKNSKNGGKKAKHGKKIVKKREQKERKKTTKEPEDIHEIMYQMSQGNWNTVIESQGGSEHFHEGPGGWNSGTGMGQFR